MITRKLEWPMFIFDIDGTIADLGHRLHFIQQEPPDWESFFASCGKDEPIVEVISLMRAIALRHDIALLTGRSDECRNTTENWLDRYDVPYCSMHMRKHGDHRQDNVVKGELLDVLLTENDIPIQMIAGVFEDRNQVVAMYRNRGLRVYQVAEGNF